MTRNNWNWPGIALRGAIVAVLAFMAVTFAAASEKDLVYVARPQALHAEAAPSSTTYGRFYTAAQLHVLERRDGWLKVAFRGWYRDGAARVLYALPGKRIFMLALKKKNIDKLHRLDSVTDPDTDITWHGAAVEGWVPEKAVTGELEEIWAAAWDLFATKCTVCHQQRIPHKYTANQWVSLIKVMGPRTGLPKTKQQLILKYLQYHAKDTGGG